MELNIQVVVESNYKIYTYTITEFSKKMIEEFSTINYELPNMMVSTIERKDCIRAFERGITAEMIADFLNTNSHKVIKLK